MNRIPVRPPGRERSGAGWAREAPERGAAIDHERAPAADRVRGLRTGSARARASAGFRRVAAAAGLVAGLWSGIGPEASATPGPSPDEPTRAASGPVRGQARPGIAPAHGRRGPTGTGRGSPSDDWTFRPTVVVRRGTSQGSGTIIASVDGETLVLTAAHVVRESGPIAVELHRYNLGLERTPAPPGAWPRPVAADAGGDRSRRRPGDPPHRGARRPALRRPAGPRRGAMPAVDSIVTSIGIDLGTRLSSWSTPAGRGPLVRAQRQPRRAALLHHRPRPRARPIRRRIVPARRRAGRRLRRPRRAGPRPSHGRLRLAGEHPPTPGRPRPDRRHRPLRAAAVAPRRRPVRRPADPSAVTPARPPARPSSRSVGRANDETSRQPPPSRRRSSVTSAESHEPAEAKTRERGDGPIG